MLFWIGIAKVGKRQLQLIKMGVTVGINDH